MSGIGILAYGSLISDPGNEIAPLIVRHIATTSPFPVEYARVSQTRGGAPTLVPHAVGNSVRAEVLVLPDSVPVAEARSYLWRRETRNEGSDRMYEESSSPNAVIVRDVARFCDLDHVLYTDFNPAGKISHPNPRELAKAAIRSIGTAPPGKDGISYLMERLSEGVETSLTARYQETILTMTGALSLAEALGSVRARLNGC
ncbi:MAG TPA: hypothetical protein VJP78_01270 [Thermoleophilia bacterium]|nr:hypothetical protein [Thermoleophilia bacterium]